MALRCPLHLISNTMYLEYHDLNGLSQVVAVQKPFPGNTIITTLMLLLLLIATHTLLCLLPTIQPLLTLVLVYSLFIFTFLIYFFKYLPDTPIMTMTGGSGTGVTISFMITAFSATSITNVVSGSSSNKTIAAGASATYVFPFSYSNVLTSAFISECNLYLDLNLIS